MHRRLPKEEARLEADVAWVLAQGARANGVTGIEIRLHLGGLGSRTYWYRLVLGRALFQGLVKHGKGPGSFYRAGGMP